MRKARIVIQMPSLRHLAQGNYWFFLPVPFMYEKWPFKEGERLLVTVERAGPFVAITKKGRKALADAKKS